MSVDIETELAIIRRKLFFGIPTNGLSIGFSYQVVSLLQRTNIVSHHARSHPVELVLRTMIGVGSDHIERSADLIFVDDRIGRSGEIVRDELVGTLVLIDQLRLPGKKIRGQPLRIALPFELPSRIDDAF